jgi:Zn-dependent protease/predicted transcriptional regulator
MKEYASISRPRSAAHSPSKVGDVRDVTTRGLKLGAPFGVQVIADYSLLFIFALIAINLGFGVLPRWHPTWSGALTAFIATCAAIAFFASIALHELAHALVGRAQGIPVRRITLFIFGGMAHMEREPPSARAEFLMAIVGPVTSLALGVVATLLGASLAEGPLSDSAMNDMDAIGSRIGPVATLLLWIGPVNVMLGLFNLVPGFPLDGGRVLRAALWGLTGDLRKATQWAAGLGQTFGAVLIGVGIAMIFGIAVPWLGRGLAAGLWTILIGWFLSNAARASFQQLLVRQALEDVLVRDVMRSRVQAVDAQLSLESLVRDYFMATDQTAFPVVESEGRLVGLVRFDNVRRFPRENWSAAVAADAMTPVSELQVLHPDDNATLALRGLAEQDPLPVTEQERLVGVARREDIVKWMAFHDPAAA